jgi:hypothetical protein
MTRFRPAPAFALVLLAAAGCGADRGPAGRPRFVDRAAEYGLAVVTRFGTPEKLSAAEALGAGVALLDFDGDDDLDLFVAPGSEVRGGAPACAGGPWLFRNDGPGRWADVTAASGLKWTGWASGVAVADYDADGDPDLFLAQLGPDVLWRNEGGGVFRDVTAAAGLSEPRPLWGASATWGDFDGDGWPDLYVTNYLDVDPVNPPPMAEALPGVKTFLGPGELPGQPDVLWRNLGDGTFSDATREAGLWSPDGKGMSALFADLDGDGRADLYVTNDTQRNELFHNLGRGRFFEEAVYAGAAYDEQGRPEGSMAVDIADLDGDGRTDLVYTNFRQEGTRVLVNQGNRTYRDVSRSSGVLAATARYVGWGMVLADFDDDGLPDLFQANGHVFPVSHDYAQPPLFLRNTGRGTFEDVTSSWCADPSSLRSGRAVAAGDLDGDGDLDLVMTTMDGPLRVLVNEGLRVNHSVTVRLEGRAPNREALGARVEVVAGGKTLVDQVRRDGSLLAASDCALHFGLGRASRVDRLTVRWPDGKTDVFSGLPADSLVRVKEGGGGPVVTGFR